MNSMKDEFILADQIREKLFLQVQKTMEKQDISQGEMARRIGAARPNINRVMCRKNAVSIDFLLKMAESIGLDVELKTRPKEPEKPYKLTEKAQRNSR